MPISFTLVLLFFVLLAAVAVGSFAFVGIANFVESRRTAFSDGAEVE